MSNLTNGQRIAKAVTETEIVADRDERPMVSQSSQSALQDALARYESIVASGGWPQVTKTRFKVGAESKDVIPLKRRLAAEGYYPAQFADNPLYTENVDQAIRQFQIDHGLAANARLDKTTLSELNIPAERRLATIRANLSRVAEYTKDLGSRYVVVNIPALQLEAVDGTKVFSRHNIIVGKPDRPSPVVMTKFSDINFNPYWNAPVSIVEKDIIPEVQHKGTRVLKQMGIRVFDGFNGPEVDPDTINWDTLAANRYLFRQDPGEENAMAAVKINFPSPFGVYMHDTPTRFLFTTGARYLSSGCVRVDKIPILVNWILNGQDGWNMGRIADMAKSEERLDVKLVDPPQIRWVYLTAWATPSGRVNFRRDIYDLDASGFVVGQPTPVGEYADDGQRFVLQLPPKPAPVAVAKADADDDIPGEPAKALPRAKPQLTVDSAKTANSAKTAVAPPKQSFGKVYAAPHQSPFARTAGAKTKPNAIKTALAADDDNKAQGRPKNNFNKLPEAKKKPVTAKASPVVPKAKPSEQATAKAGPVTPVAKPVMATAKAAKKPAPDDATIIKKKKKPAANVTASAESTPRFGAQ